MRRANATRSTRAGPRSTRRRWPATRSSSCSRSTGSCAAGSSFLRRPTRLQSRLPRARHPKSRATATPLRSERSSSSPAGSSMSCSDRTVAAGRRDRAVRPVRSACARGAASLARLAIVTLVRRALAAAGSARVVDTAKDAQVILDIPSVTDDKEVLSLTGAGSVREYELTKRVEFRLHDAEGGEWLPPGEITLRRSYSFSESEVLAREAQEQRLLKDMQNDAVQQLVRRLQAARKPA